MRRVFADTFYWIALLNPGDQAHDLAVSVSKRNRGRTTESCTPRIGVSHCTPSAKTSS